MQEALIYIKYNLIDADGAISTYQVIFYVNQSFLQSFVMYLTVDSLIKIYNIITVSNNITPRKVNVKPYIWIW